MLLQFRIVFEFALSYCVLTKKLGELIENDATPPQLNYVGFYFCVCVGCVCVCFVVLGVYVCVPLVGRIQCIQIGAVLFVHRHRKEPSHSQQTATQQIAQRRQIGNSRIIRIDLPLPHRMHNDVSNIQQQHYLIVKKWH